MTDLEQILRHRHPMIFLDSIVDSSDKNLVASVEIREGLPFFEPQRGVPAWVGIEYMAQSIAALAGIRARKAGTPVPLGMIIGCRNFTCDAGAFPPGSELRIAVTELAAEDDGFGVFDCKIEGTSSINHQSWTATARISVFGGDRQKAA